MPRDIKNVDIDVKVFEGAIKSDYFIFISLLLLLFLAGLLGC